MPFVCLLLNAPWSEQLLVSHGQAGLCTFQGRHFEWWMTVLCLLCRCCNSTVLDAGGYCCASELLDDCGVCDGDGSSCKLHIVVTTQVPDTRSWIPESSS